MNDSRPLLIVIGGLPGTGKTTLALAPHLDACFVRVDTVEQFVDALR